MLPQAQKTLILSEEEFEALFAHQGQHPADLREEMRTTLRKLPQVARAVYPERENIQDPATPLLVVVETVLYSFDRRNRERVADGLDMLYDDLVLILVGVVLGQEEVA